MPNPPPEEHAILSEMQESCTLRIAGPAADLPGHGRAGKDSAIKHVMSGVNPRAVTYTPSSSPATRARPRLSLADPHRVPERGRIGIFNRSYYEESGTRVHPKLLEAERLPIRW